MNQDKNIYIALSFGPIDRIIGYSKSTRAIWASSYMFSFLAKHIVYGYFQRPEVEFLKPSISEFMFIKSDGVGRFPDQYVLRTKKDIKIEEIRETCDKTIGELADNMAEVLKGVKKEDIFAYLKRALRIVIIKKVYKQDKSDKEVVEDMQEMMSYVECRDSYNAKETRNYLSEYFESVTNTSLLRCDAVNKNDKNLGTVRLFDTILECAAGDEYKNKKAALLKGECDNQLKPYQKYIAFVSADGDHFGKTLAAKGKDALGVFNEYNDKIRDTVANYGGQVIYQGGDDILFFAPLYNTYNGDGGGKIDIFQLIEKIDSAFSDILKKYEKTLNFGELRPSLSYGVAISYYKHPMGEIKKESEGLLDELKENGRNKVSWKVRKHSGQTFSAVFDKSGDEYSKNVTFISACLAQEGDFLHSVTHWLMAKEEQLSLILSVHENRTKKLSNSFKNSFDEGVHGIKQDFLTKVQKYLLTFPTDKGIKMLHVLMRYVELLISKRK